MRDEEITMPDGFNLKLTNSALSAFMEKFDKDKSKVEVKKNEIVIDFDGDGRADQSINMKTKDLKYGYSDYQNGVTKNSKADGKYTYIDFDGDGRTDAKIKSKKLSKNNMSDPITLKGNSREVQELIEQRYVLEFAKKAAENKAVPDLKEAQKIAKLIANIDKKLNSYNAGVGTDEFKLKNDAIQAKKESIKVEDNTDDTPPVDVIDEAAADIAAAEAKKKKAEEKTEIGVDSKIMVTNALNKNGSIDGTVTNVVKDDKGKITSFSLKSAKGNEFNYEYDAKTDRYVNKKENKYYIMQEDGSLVRDNKLGKPIAKPGNGNGDSDSDKTQKTMATSGSGRYTKVIDGKTHYYAADDTELKEDYYKSKEAIAEKTNVVDAFDKPTDLKLTDLMSYKGNYVDKDGRVFEAQKDKDGKIKFVEIAAANPATLPPFIPIGEKKNVTQATTPETTVAQASPTSTKRVATVVEDNIKKSTFYDKDGNVDPDKFIRSDLRLYSSLKPINDGYSTRMRKVSYQELRNDFDKQLFTTSYLNSLVNNYGKKAVEDFVNLYNEEAKMNGDKSIQDHIWFNGTAFINDTTRDALGMKPLKKK